MYPFGGNFVEFVTKYEIREKIINFYSDDSLLHGFI
jgi:hypothetical protein